MGCPWSSPPTKGATPLLLLAALASLGACERCQPADTALEPAEQTDPQAPAALRLEALDRAAILSAVAQAGSAFAAGANDSAAQRALDGRQFEFRIRFGCDGPSAALPKEWLGWSLVAESGVLKVRAQPTLDAKDPLVQQLGGSQFEAIEGFWIPRPWLQQSACPAVAARPEEAAEPAVEKDESKPDVPNTRPTFPRVGIAQYFSDTDTRTGRRSMRPYEAVKTLEAGGTIGAQGLELILSGRLKALPGKRVVACGSKGPDSPPDCIVSAEFDRVRIEVPQSKEVIAEWSTS